MAHQQLRPDVVLTSQWCRCQDTARLAFGQAEDWPALNSTFAGQGSPDSQEAAMRARLRQMPQDRMEIWVTHQVNMTAVSGAYPDLGEAFVLDRQGRLLVRGWMSA
jgi:phosphohistidine phosphatase SixA